MFRFEKLDVCQKVIDYAGDLHKKTRRFPSDERFDLASQMRRAAVSVSSNIAKGSGRTSEDFARFVELAYGSLMERVSQAQIANHQGWIQTVSTNCANAQINLPEC